MIKTKEGDTHIVGTLSELIADYMVLTEVLSEVAGREMHTSKALGFMYLMENMEKNIDIILN